MHKNRLKEWRLKSDLSVAKLGEMVGASGPTISRIENWTVKLSADMAEKIGRVLGVDPARLLFEDDALLRMADRLSQPQRGVQAVTCVGIVEAGAWREANGDEVHYTVMIPESMAAPDCYALEVRGDSMNELYAPGSIVICRPMISMFDWPQHGQRVHVERTDGPLVEATLKEFRLTENEEAWLWPRSTNPEHRPVRLDGDETADTGFEIRGVVIGSYRPE